MGQAEDITQKMCSLEDIEPGSKWQRVLQVLYRALLVYIRLDRECRQLNPVVAEVEVQAILYENSFEVVLSFIQVGLLFSKYAAHCHTWRKPKTQL